MSWQSHHSSFFESYRRYKIPRETPLRRALNTRMCGNKNLRYSTEYLRLYRKWYEMDPWLQRITNNKSRVADQSASVPVTLCDLERETRGSVFRRISIHTLVLSDLVQIWYGNAHGGGVCFLSVSYPSPRRWWTVSVAYSSHLSEKMLADIDCRLLFLSSS